MQKMAAKDGFSNRVMLVATLRGMEKTKKKRALWICVGDCKVYRTHDKGEVSWFCYKRKIIIVMGC